MSSGEISCQQGVLTDGKEAEERPHTYEYSCVVASHVSDYDEKLKASITEGGDHRIILIIGGIELFL
jgi:hypothetical protein